MKKSSGSPLSFSSSIFSTLCHCLLHMIHIVVNLHVLLLLLDLVSLLLHLEQQRQRVESDFFPIPLLGSHQRLAASCVQSNFQVRT
jgi:hypothetical protein